MKTIHFSKSTPDLRSRQSIVDFLKGHYRYDTMGSNNQSTSYANCVKLHRLPLTPEQSDVAYDMLSTDNGFDFVNPLIHKFTEQHNGGYTAGFNGRSGGYLVLYHSQYKPSDYKSICTECGQRNYREVFDAEELTAPELAVAQLLCRRNNLYNVQQVLEDGEFQALALAAAEATPLVRRWLEKRKSGSFDNRCGVCHEHARVPYSARELSIWPGRSLDHYEEFDKEEWSMSALVDRARLVMSFDKLCDDILNELISVTTRYRVVTKTVMVPKEIRVLENA